MQPTVVPISKRTPLACVACRRRKTKCDGVQPQCHYCSSRGIPCQWPLSPGTVTTSPTGRNVYTLPETDERVTNPSSTGDPGRRSLSADLSPRVSVENVSVLPSQAALQRCLAIFFERHLEVDLCCFFHRPSFDPTNPNNRFLVTSIVSLCARYLTADEARVLFDAPSQQQVYRHFTRLAKKMARETSDLPSVTNIQANLVLSLSELLSEAPSGQWMYAGTAIRMAQVMRLNKEYHDKHPEQEREVRRRTFWACLLFDRLLAFFLAKPHTLSLKNVAIALPSSNLSLAYGEPSRGVTLANLATYNGSASDLGLLPYVIKSLCLWCELANFHVCQARRSEPLPPTDPYSQFSMFSTAVRSWMDLLPSRLRWSRENHSIHLALNQGAAFMAMHCLLRSALCVAHQDYLPQTDGSSILLDQTDAAGWSLLHREPSIVSTCVSNALAVGELVSAYIQSETSEPAPRPSIFVALAILSAASPLLWLQYTEDPQEFGQDRGRAWNYFLEFQNLLSCWRKVWKIAHVWLREVEEMRVLYRYAYQGEVDANSTEHPAEECSCESGGDQEESDLYRPQPGDGLPQCSWPSDLTTLLQLNSVTKVSLPAEHQLSVWLALTRGWQPGVDDDIFLDINDRIAVDS
ncbi:hypothetical protein ABEF95_005312 [Exophiala dermatitidis]